VVVRSSVKIQGIRKKMHKGKCPLWLGGEDIQHILLSCSETIKRGTEFLNKRSLNMKEETAYKEY
jgi:hypothetical protein